ncbi:MAG TPA: ABC transporter ATP-binding protein [Acetobacteraceae bacterium]
MNTLEVHALEAGYGDIRVLRGIDLAVPDGAVVALLGANGAGKTTTLRALSGTIRGRGRITLDGEDMSALGPAERVRRGIAHVPQGRGTFVDFTVEENLTLGAYAIRSGPQIRSDIDYWFSAFPRLLERRRQRAGSLSGGEQQMLAIARALMTRPRLLLCDELSQGLAPVITKSLFALLARLNAERQMAILLVEQNAALALRIAEHAYVLEHGEIAVQGSAAVLAQDARIQRAYLGR